MTGPGYFDAAQPTPWQEYITTEKVARAGYLASTARAQEEYLTGPYPDRAAYQLVEQQAWLSYHHAARQAWARMRAATEPRPPAPPMPADYPAPPLPIYDSIASSGPRLIQPTFTEHPGGDQ